MLNICSAKFDIMSGCVSAFVYSVYGVLEDRTLRIIMYKFVYTCGCVFFLFGVMCGFVTKVSLECVVCIVCYVVFGVLKLSYFPCGFLLMD